MTTHLYHGHNRADVIQRQLTNDVDPEVHHEVASRNWCNTAALWCTNWSCGPKSCAVPDEGLCPELLPHCNMWYGNVMSLARRQVMFQWLLFATCKCISPSGHYMHHQFNTQQFYVLPTECIFVLCGSENKQRLFPCTTLTDWFFITEI